MIKFGADEMVVLVPVFTWVQNQNVRYHEPL